ncbi:MAG: hypothetical protein HY021_01155 [Burkholderiales bacterium]|nr:hypothetical protein [Burkholderiales bacterium]
MKNAPSSVPCGAVASASAHTTTTKIQAMATISMTVVRISNGGKEYHVSKKPVITG